MSNIVPASVLADVLSCSIRTVQRYAEEGLVVRVKGKPNAYDFDESIQAYNKDLDRQLRAKCPQHWILHEKDLYRKYGKDA
jgi:phage terminase Nu1 subunit (DNA packaging protein)